MKQRFFITGTDTDVGKTYLSVGLLNLFTSLGFTTLGLKPVASGCMRHNGHLYNLDALLLQQASSLQLSYDIINPFAFEPGIAPHLAAKQSATTLTLKKVNEALHRAFNTSVDIFLVEGAGGWHTPLNEKETMAEVVMHYQLNTILIVRIHLGCLNHAILTERAIRSSGVPLFGWIANYTTGNIENGEEQINTLKHFLSAPLLGVVNFNEDPKQKINHRIILASTSLI
jgi:dethiobiotin synthetase